MNPTTATAPARRGQPTRSLRSAIAHEWESHVDDTRSMRSDQLDGMTPFLEWLQRAVTAAELDGLRDVKDIERHDDGSISILRPLPVIVKRVDGWEPTGSVKGDRRKWGARLRRNVEYCERLGWMVAREPVLDATGQGKGIRLTLTPAGVAFLASCRRSSVGEATFRRRRGAHGPPGASGGERATSHPVVSRGSGPAEISGQVVSPSRQRQRSDPPRSSRNPGTAGVPRAFPANATAGWLRSTRQQSPASFQRGAAITDLRATTTEPRPSTPVDHQPTAATDSPGSSATAAKTEGVPAIEVLKAAAVDGVDPVAVAIVGWERLVDPCRHPALSARRRAHLVQACLIADRYGSTAGPAPGAGLASLLEEMDHDRRQGVRVESLGYYVCQLRRRAKAWRRMAKGLPPETTKTIVNDDGEQLQLSSGWWDEREQRLGPEAAAKAELEFRRRRAKKGRR